METAIPTNLHTFKRVAEEMPTPESVAEKADRELGSLANDPRWEQMVAVIDGMITQIEALETIGEDDSLESIGVKFMVARLATSQLKILKNLPESIAQSDGQKTE